MLKANGKQLTAITKQKTPSVQRRKGFRGTTLFKAVANCVCLRQEKQVFLVVNQFVFSGAKETRTPDLFNAIEALSQLSYSPILLLKSRDRNHIEFQAELQKIYSIHSNNNGCCRDTLISQTSISNIQLTDEFGQVRDVLSAGDTSFCWCYQVQLKLV